MSSTHLNLHYHLIFSTKERKPLINDSCQERLHAFLGGALRTVDGKAVAIGGTNDHIHMLIGLKATHRLSDVLREIKSSSSGWVHKTVGIRDFSWQDGYGAFTVSPSLIEHVTNYIACQQQHHLKRTYQQEYLDFLQKSGVEYDARYLW